MKRFRALSCLLLAAVLLPFTGAAEEGHPTARRNPRLIQPSTIQKHVDYLADDKLQGRFAKSPHAKQAAEYIAKHFEEYGLTPLGDDETYYQALRDRSIAPNVVGAIPGKGKGYVLVTAHYDHLEPAKEGDDKIYNGADDNASGVAAVLAIAEALARRSVRTNMTFVFVAFTAEELGLRGSRHFVASSPVPLDEIHGVINMDMISRGKRNLIFCEGGEFEVLREASDKANEEVGLDIRYDEHPDWRGASDHAHFMRRKIPTMYFGVEDHEDYHRVSDHADKIMPDLAAKVAELVLRIMIDLGDDELPGKTAETDAERDR